MIIGIILIWNTFQIDNAIDKDCVNHALVTSNKMILIIAVIAMTGTIGDLICSKMCACSQKEIFNTFPYVLFIFILGIMLLSMGVIIKTNATGKCSGASGPANTIITIGSILAGLAGIYLLVPIIHKFKNTHKNSMTSAFGGG
jgi:cation transport ATPase